MARPSFADGFTALRVGPRGVRRGRQAGGAMAPVVKMTRPERSATHFLRPCIWSGPASERAAASPLGTTRPRAASQRQRGDSTQSGGQSAACYGGDTSERVARENADQSQIEAGSRAEFPTLPSAMARHHRVWPPSRASGECNRMLRRSGLHLGVSHPSSQSGNHRAATFYASLRCEAVDIGCALSSPLEHAQAREQTNARHARA